MNDKNYKQLMGLKIRQLRKKMNKTQDAFCSEIDLEVPNLSNIENGKSFPSIQTIMNIINVYKIEPNEFFNFLNWNPADKDELTYEINEYLTTLSYDLKTHVYHIIKNLSE